MDIGKNIREAREEQGLLVSEVARRAGVTVSGVQFVEEGRVRNPTVSTVVKIARALGVEPGELLKEHPASPLVLELPSTPVTGTPVEVADEWLRSTGSAAEVEKRLRVLEAEARDLEEFHSRHISPRLDRARRYRAALLDRLVEQEQAERHGPALRSWTVYITRLADRWEEEIAQRMRQAAEPNRAWAHEIDETATEITATAGDELEVALGVSKSPEALGLFRALQRLDEVISRTSAWFDAPANFEAHRRQRRERLRALPVSA